MQTVYKRRQIKRRFIFRNFSYKERKDIFLLINKIIWMKREIFELENMLIIYHIPSKQKRNITNRLSRVKEQIWLH